jgi:Recombination endonuclease VII
MENVVCKKCSRSLPQTDEYFKKTKLTKSGFYKSCKMCIAQYAPEYGRRKQLERRHKMTIQQYEDKLAAQGGHCALCEAVQYTHTRRLVVDHDHRCCPSAKTCGNCSRGILCADCNRRIGFLEEILEEASVSPLLLTWTARALRYLSSYKAKGAYA